LAVYPYVTVFHSSNIIVKTTAGEDNKNPLSLKYITNITKFVNRIKQHNTTQHNMYCTQAAASCVRKGQL